MGYNTADDGAEIKNNGDRIREDKTVPLSVCFKRDYLNWIIKIIYILFPNRGRF